MVHRTRQVENAGGDCLKSFLQDLCGSSSFPALKRRAVGSRPFRSSLRSFAEKADYVILIQENT